MDQNAIDKATVAELRLRLFGPEPVPTKAHEEAIARILAVLFPDDEEDADVVPEAVTPTQAPTRRRR